MNKKFRKILLLLMLIMIVPFVMTSYACKDKVKDIQLVSVSEEYNVGDILKPEDFSIIITYTNKKVETIKVTSDMLVTELPELNEEGSVTIAVEYDKKQYNVTITIVNPKKIRDVELTDYKVNYETYDEFKANGNLVIKYVDETLTDTVLPITENMIDVKPDMTTAGEKTVVVKFNKVEYTYTIVVKERALVSYIFKDVKTTYYNTATKEDIDITSGKLILTYSNETKVIDLTNDMIDYVPDLIDGGVKIVKIKVGENTYELRLTIINDPEFEKYEQLIESIKNMLSTSLAKNTSIKAEASIELDSKVMGEVEKISEKYNADLKLDDIKDLYLVTMTEEVIKSLLESSDITIEDFIKNAGNIKLDINTARLLMNMLDRFVQANVDFDFNAYINSNPMLKETKAQTLEFLADVINLSTFQVPKYTIKLELDNNKNINLRLYYTEEYKRIIEIADETIFTPAMSKNFDVDNFLKSLKSYAESYREVYPEKSVIITKIIDIALNKNLTKHTLSNVLKETFDELNKDETLKAEIYAYIDVVSYFEDYLIDNKTITFVETINKCYDKLAEAYSQYTEAPTRLVIALNTFETIKKVANDKRYASEILIGLVFDSYIKDLYSQLEGYSYMMECSLKRVSEYQSYIDYRNEQIEIINSKIDELKASGVDPSIESDIQLLYREIEYHRMIIDDYNNYINCENEYISQYQNMLNEVVTNLNNTMSLKAIFVEYTHDVAFGNEVDYKVLITKVSEIFGFEDTATIINYYLTQYEAIKTTTLLTDVMDMYFGQYRAIIEQYIGTDLTNISYTMLFNIADRLQKANIIETDLKTDIIEIISNAYGEFKLIPEIAPYMPTIEYLFNFVQGNVEITEDVKESMMLIYNQVMTMIYDSLTPEQKAIYDMTVNYLNLGKELTQAYLDYAKAHNGESGVLYNFIIENIYTYADAFGVTIPEQLKVFIDNPHSLVTDLNNLVNLRYGISMITGIEDNELNTEYYTNVDKIILNLDNIIDLIIYNEVETEKFVNEYAILNNNVYALALAGKSIIERDGVQYPYADIYDLIIEEYDNPEIVDKTYFKKFVGETILTYKDLGLEYYLRQYLTAIDTENKFDIDTIVSELDSMVIELVNAYLYDNAETVVNTKLHFENIIASLNIQDSKNTLIYSIIAEIQKINPNVDTEQLYTLINTMLSDITNGTIENVIVDLRNLTDTIGFETLSALINNYINEGNIYLVREITQRLTALYYNDLVANTGYIKTDIDINFVNALTTLSESIDKYLAKDELVTIDTIINNYKVALSYLEDISKLHSDFDMFITSKILNIVTYKDLKTVEARNELQTLFATIEILPYLNEINIDNYLELEPAILTIVTAYNNNAINTKIVIDALIKVDMICDIAVNNLANVLNLDTDGYNSLSNLVYNIRNSYVNGDANVQKLAEEYFAFANTYGGENIQFMYALGIITLVYTEQDVDFNILLKDIPLPEGIKNVDYNKLINRIVTKEVLENIITTDGIKEVLTYNDEDKSIVKQELVLNFNIDFDITFIVYKGSINLSLSLTY